MANTTVLNLVKPLGTDHALVSDINANSDKIDAEAGKVRANFAEEYSPSSPYAVGAFCTHDGIVYQCNTAIGSGGEAWTAGHWTQTPVGDAITASNQAIATLNGKIPNFDYDLYEPTESVPANSYKDYTINFNKTFTSTPKVIASMVGYYRPITEVTGPNILVVTTTYFMVRYNNGYSSTLTPKTSWLAIE